MGILRRVTGDTPHNYGRSDKAMPAQQELDYTISRANRQYIEAFNVDGTPIHYWKRTNEGYYCTCGFGHAQAENSDTTRIDDPANPIVNNIPVNPVPPNSSPTAEDDSFIIRGAWDLEPPASSDNTVMNNVPLADQDNSGEGSELGTSTDERNREVNAEQATDEEDAFLNAPNDFGLMSGIEKTQCGICLGQGKTSAWSLFAGKREIFDSHNAVTMSRFTIDKEARPYKFVSPRDQEAYVEFIYNLPTYFTTCLNYAVRNNIKSVRDLKIFYKIDGTADEFQRMTLEFLNSRNGTPTRLVLRVMPIITSLEGTLEFTHLEFIWQFADFPKIQVPPLSVASNPQTNDVTTSNSFTFPPSIDKVERNDAFFESKYSRIWRVTDYTDFMTTNRQVLGWQVSARNLQEYEQMSLLKIAHERYYEISFAGLRGFQGHDLLGNDQV